MIAVTELLTPSNTGNKKTVKLLKNDEKIIFRIKGNNAAYMIIDKLKYISPLKVYNGRECVKVSLTHSGNLRKSTFSKKVQVF